MNPNKDNDFKVSSKDYIVLSLGEYNDDIWEIDKIVVHDNYSEFIVTLLKDNPENKHYAFDYPIIYIINTNKLNLIYCNDYKINKFEGGRVELNIKVYAYEL